MLLLEQWIAREAALASDRQAVCVYIYIYIHVYIHIERERERERKRERHLSIYLYGYLILGCIVLYYIKSDSISANT